MVLELPEVRFGSPNKVSDGTDLSEITNPVQNYLLCSNPENNIFTDGSSLTQCLEVLESFPETAVKLVNNLWFSVLYTDEYHILMELFTRYKEIRAANAIKEEFLLISAPISLCLLGWVPAQPPHFDVGKVRSSGFVA